MLYRFMDQSPVLEADDIFIAPGASVLGAVTLQARVSIWFGAVLRGDIEPIRVGEGSNVQDLTLVHTSHGFPVVIGRNVTVGHQATLHGCRVGDGTLIGMKATLLDGCVIGAHCLIGAGSLVKEGQQIPDGVLAVGAPARVVRALTEEELGRLQRSAAHYVQTAKQYREQGLNVVGK